MQPKDGSFRFETRLLRPVQATADDDWTFLVLPREVSAGLPRRGMTTIAGTINGHAFQATLEPDGNLSHWLKVDASLRHAARLEPGDTVTLEIAPVAQEPDPLVPSDLQEALLAAPEAGEAWAGLTAVARLDWIHWISSAKRLQTRTRRICNTCDMLASGKRRVCCFDTSGFYGKNLSAPRAKCD